MLKFFPENHEYTFNGVKSPGVTETLGASVRSFYGPEAEPARLFGTALHKTIALLEAGKKIAFDSQLIPYIFAWEKFKGSIPGMRPLYIEAAFYSARYQYAGTIDYAGIAPKGDLILVDIKTGSKTALWAIQVAAYWNLLCEEKHRPRRVYTVKLEENNYSIIDYTAQVSLNFTAFLSFLNVYKWKLKNGIK